MRTLRSISLVWVALVLAVLFVHIFFPQRSGPLALSEVLEPYIALTGLLAAFVAFWAESRFARVLVVVFAVVLVARCAPAWISNPGPGVGPTLQVMAWNMEAGPEAGQRALDGALRSRAAVIGLEELRGDAASALEADGDLAARLPYRILEPDASVLGMGLLSRYPIVEHEYRADPPMIRALIAPDFMQPIAVFVVHPLPGNFDTIAGIPFSLDTEKRDADIALIRSLVGQDLGAGRAVIVLGDINTTEREPAYADLSAGLHDAQLDAGLGPGLTWRPPSLSHLPFGLLRIDYVFASTPLVVTSSFVDCGLPSDHCRLEATIFFGAGTQL